MTGHATPDRVQAKLDQAIAAADPAPAMSGVIQIPLKEWADLCHAIWDLTSEATRS